MTHQPAASHGRGIRSRRLSRREIVTLISVAGGGIVTAAVAVPVVGYLLGPLFNSSPNQWLDLGAVSDFVRGPLSVVGVAVAGWAAWRAGRTGRVGLGWVASVGVILVTSAGIS